MRTLTDRLLDFAREQNFELVGEFEALRNELRSGHTAGMLERLDRWQGRLEQHASWGEGQLFAAYERRCRPDDVVKLDELVRDHRLLARLAGELGEHLARGACPTTSPVRELLIDIDAVLTEHRVQEETEVCAALDHALDAPTIERIEIAYDSAPPRPGRER